MEEADKGWIMIWIGEWVNVSSGTISPGLSCTKGRKTVVVVPVVKNRFEQPVATEHQNISFDNNNILPQLSAW